MLPVISPFSEAQSETAPACARRACWGRFLARREIRHDWRAAVAAELAEKNRLDIGKPHTIMPSVRADNDGMAALKVGAANSNRGYAGLAHFAKGDLFLPLHHYPSFARSIAGDVGFLTFNQCDERPGR